MDAKNPHPSDSLKLKALIKAADLKSFRLDALRRGLVYPGRTREWLFVAHLNGAWLHLYTLVCALPEEAGLRARLLEVTMQTNSAMTLAKFTTGSHLLLEIDYRSEHIDAPALRNLIGYMHMVAEEQYPKVFRIATGDEALEALEASMLAKPAA